MFKTTPLTVEDLTYIHSFFMDKTPNKAEILKALETATCNPDIEETRYLKASMIKRIESVSDEDFENLEYGMLLDLSDDPDTSK